MFYFSIKIQYLDKAYKTKQLWHLHQR